MQKLLTYIIYFFVVISCHSTKTMQTKMYRVSIPVVDFCDLPKYKGQQVYIKVFYSGVVEYWGMHGRKKCNEKLTVDLQSKQDNPISSTWDPPKKFLQVFQEVSNYYNKSFLEIEAIGIFENDNKRGYGHLGSNNSRFLVTELINAKLIQK